MNTPLSSRARRLGTFAAVGATTLITALAVAAVTAGATSPAQVAEPPRITVTAGVACANDGTPQAINLAYDDHVDGHVPQTVHESINEGSTVVWTRDELHQDAGDYFNFTGWPQQGTSPLNPTAMYTYFVTITYDDDVTQTQSVTVVPSGSCTPTPTTPPPTTAMRTSMSSTVITCPTATTTGAVRFAYDDHVDGHAPVSVHEELADQSGVLWSIDDVHQVNGDYFNSRDFPATAAIPITATSRFAYSVTITYDDGVTQMNWTPLNVAASCPAAGGVLPATL